MSAAKLTPAHGLTKIFMSWAGNKQLQMPLCRTSTPRTPSVVIRSVPAP